MPTPSPLPLLDPRLQYASIRHAVTAIADLVRSGRPCMPGAVVDQLEGDVDASIAGALR